MDNTILLYKEGREVAFPVDTKELDNRIKETVDAFINGKKAYQKQFDGIAKHADQIIKLADEKTVEAFNATADTQQLTRKIIEEYKEIEEEVNNRKIGKGSQNTIEALDIGTPQEKVQKFMRRFQINNLRVNLINENIKTIQAGGIIKMLTPPQVPDTEKDPQRRQFNNMCRQKYGADVDPNKIWELKQEKKTDAEIDLFVTALKKSMGIGVKLTPDQVKIKVVELTASLDEFKAEQGRLQIFIKQNQEEIKKQAEEAAAAASKSKKGAGPAKPVPVSNDKGGMVEDAPKEEVKADDMDIKKIKATYSNEQLEDYLKQNEKAKQDAEIKYQETMQVRFDLKNFKENFEKQALSELKRTKIIYKLYRKKLEKTYIELVFERRFFVKGIKRKIEEFLGAGYQVRADDKESRRLMSSLEIVYL